ncbi:DUF5344 family protein [Alkalicoccobacillus porphyridii]|uniref:TIGR04197 family type VII secretion effector n=1 Tax=Alkalicoccobacillus porphyridii TaxID=2597270 RepID=A0A553ZUQ7_9BACI|nr:DUF5344 family protein [Alkalicoccobacillus porphyridii]TSB45221.1 hypothetical protein FN960_17300 [Alkalicoccobacillus porphyridii]
MSDEIQLSPEMMTRRFETMRSRINELTISNNSYSTNNTKLDSIDLLLEIMSLSQDILNNYQSLVLSNADQIESLVDQFIQAESQVATEIAKG